MAASVRTWLVVTALACGVLLLLRTADAQKGEAAETAEAQAPSPTSAAEVAEAVSAVSSSSSSLPRTPAKKPKCEAGSTKACRVGAVHDPENQEEEGIFNVKVKAPSGAGDTESDDDYSDPDQPQQDDLIVVGH